MSVMPIPTPMSSQYSDSDTYASSMVSVLEGRGSWHDDRTQNEEELRRAVKERLCDGVSIEEFVQHVWGFPVNSLRDILEEDWFVDEKTLERYQVALRGTGNQHTAFRLISDSLLNDVHVKFGMDFMDMDDEFFDSKGKACLENAYRGVKGDPDFLRVWKSENEATIPGWEDVKAFVHLAAVKSSGSHRQGEPPEGPEHLFGPPLPSAQQPVTPPRGLKRQRSSDEPTFASDAACATDELTDDELRLALYAKECFTVYADRWYVTALLIDGFEVSLWYFDHHLAMRTVQFNFSLYRGVKYLALTLFALTKCDMQGAGFNPFLQKLCLLSPQWQVGWEPLLRPAQQVEEYCFVFPQREEDQRRRFFIVEDWVDSTYRFIGPGTTTHTVRTGLFGGKVAKEYQTLKMTWRAADEDHEENTLDDLMVHLPYKWTLHLPLDLTFSGLYSLEDLELPWTQMNLRLPRALRDVERPYLHVSVFTAYQPLWMAASIEEFKTVFLDCLECHYHAHEEAEHLHGAISERSLKVHIRNEVCFPDMCPVGVLTDWEIGPQPRQHDDAQHPLELGHGAGPFTFTAAELALDVQHLGTATTHYYRHDLESFFYLLIWACVHYNLKEQCRDLVDPHGLLQEWSSKKLSSHSKITFINSLYGRDDKVSELIKSEFEELYQNWVRPLRRLFREALASIPGELDDDENYDFRTCNGRLTFERFMDAIGQEPRGLRSAQ